MAKPNRGDSMPGKPDDVLTGQEYLDTIIDPLVDAGLYQNRGQAMKVFGPGGGRSRKQIEIDAVAEIRKGG